MSLRVYIKFGTAKKSKPTNLNPKGKVKYAIGEDRKIAMYGFMDNSACFIFDVAYILTTSNG